MLLQDMLGRTVSLKLRRFAADHAEFAADDELVRVARHELGPELRLGDTVDLFVQLDPQGIPFGTTRRPRLERGEVAFLEVRAFTRYGAFVDMGLDKDLLVPFAEQTRDLSPGDVVPIGLVLDRHGRSVGTMKVREMVGLGGDFQPDEWVEGEAWRKEPGVGVFVILERRFLALLPEGEPHGLCQGERARFRVVHVMNDGKVEVSLRGHVHEEIDADAERVLARIEQGDLRVSDKSDPDEIRALFGLSKKAFKRAVGRLLKDGAVRLDARGEITSTR